MADYSPIGPVVPKMDDDLPAVTSMGTTLTPTPVTTSGTILSTSAVDYRHTEGTVCSRIMSRLEGYS